MPKGTLNDRQRLFAQLLVQGMAAGRAYEKAGYDARGDIADQKASRMLARNGKVVSYVDQLREEAESKAVMSARDKREMLKRIADENREEDPRVSIAAIDQDNKMTGGHAKQEVDVKIDHGGVMVIPMPTSDDQWEQLSQGSQARLMDDAIDID